MLLYKFRHAQNELTNYRKKNVSNIYITAKLVHPDSHIQNIEFSVTLICSIAYQHNAQVEIAQFAIPYFQSTEVVCD